MASSRFCENCGTLIFGPTSSAVQQEVRLPSKTFAMASGRTRYVGLGLLAAGLLLSFVGGDVRLVSFFFFFAALAVLLQTSSLILRLGLPFIGALVLLMPGLEIERRAAQEKEAQQADVLKKAAAGALEKALQEERARSEQQRQKMPEIYAKAVTTAKAGNYSGAITLFEELIKLDPDYKDVPLRMKSARERLATAQVAERLNEANLFSKSNNCSTLQRAESDFAEVARLSAEKAAAVAPSLLKVREKMLTCYEGNGDLQMAIQIVSKRPVCLHVSIKNMSDHVRHANPTYFTLITKSGESHSYSSESFSYPKPFGAVQLQPQTETSGIVVFDTYAPPRTLIYQEFLGARVSRDFP